MAKNTSLREVLSKYENTKKATKNGIQATNLKVL